MKTFTEFLNEETFRTSAAISHGHHMDDLKAVQDHHKTQGDKIRIKFRGPRSGGSDSYTRKENATHFDVYTKTNDKLGKDVKPYGGKRNHGLSKSNVTIKENVGERKHEYPHSVLVYDKDGSLHHIAQFKDLHGASAHYSKQVKVHGKKRKVSMITTTAKQNNVIHLHALHKPGDKVVEDILLESIFNHSDKFPDTKKKLYNNISKSSLDNEKAKVAKHHVDRMLHHMHLHNTDAMSPVHLVKAGEHHDALRKMGIVESFSDADTQEIIAVLNEIKEYSAQDFNNGALLTHHKDSDNSMHMYKQHGAYHILGWKKGEHFRDSAMTHAEAMKKFKQHKAETVSEAYDTGSRQFNKDTYVVTTHDKKTGQKKDSAGFTSKEAAESGFNARKGLAGGLHHHLWHIKGDHKTLINSTSSAMKHLHGVEFDKNFGKKEVKESADLANAKDSLKDEQEAIGKYNKQIKTSSDKDLKATLKNNLGQEKEHAKKLSSWILNKQKDKSGK